MLEVTAAVMREGPDVLIARRAPGRRMAGLWEFPGGKTEPGETPQAALARELREELDIETRIGPLLDAYCHDYGPEPIRILFFAVERVRGEIRLCDHDEVAWVPASRLGNYEFAPADLRFVNRLRSEALAATAEPRPIPP